MKIINEIKNTKDFIGNIKTVEKFKKWIKDVSENKIKKKVCFLTGCIGVGKSLLAKISLEEEGFNIFNFLATELRIKSKRELLYQTIGFKNVLAIINKKKNFKKAIVIDNYENMALAKQEIFRKIKKILKNNKSINIPIIFIGNTYFKNKKPLMGISNYIRLEPRNIKDINLILEQIITKNNIKITKKDKENLCKKSGGDIRKIIKYFEINSKINSENMFLNKKKGPLFSLNRIFNEDLSVNDVLEENSCEKTLPLGAYMSYINYVPWITKNKKNIDPLLYKNISEIFSIYGSLKDYERKYQYWDFDDIATVISLYGTKVILNNIPDSKKKYKKSYKGKQFWWEDLKKGKKKGDEPIDISIYSKHLRSHLNKSMICRFPYKMIEKRICNPISWKPKNIRHTLQIMNLKKTKDISNYILNIIKN